MASQLGPPVCQNQFVALEKTDSILYLVQVQATEPNVSIEQDIPLDLQLILDKFQSIFNPPTALPPPRPGDHTIPLLEGAQPL